MRNRNQNGKEAGWGRKGGLGEGGAKFDHKRGVGSVVNIRKVVTSAKKGTRGHGNR